MYGHVIMIIIKKHIYIIKNIFKKKSHTPSRQIDIGFPCISTYKNALFNNNF